MKSLAAKLTLLDDALDLAAGRLDPTVEADARAVAEHASRRLTAGEQTVAALAGATGSGKSSLFNALSGTRLAEHGPRRPTTSSTLSVSFSATNPELLDLLGVTRRHEAEPPIREFESLVLLDLPDHDSTATAHRVEVDRMVDLVDQFIWVLDPQKYADAAIHQRYLRPLAGHRDVMTVVLNQADLLNPRDLQRCLDHIRRLLAADGLDGVPLLATSAVTGQGIDELRRRLGKIAKGKKATTARLAADLARVTVSLDGEVGPSVPAELSQRSRARLSAALSEAAGAGLVVNAVERSVLHRGALATGWPLVSWLRRLKPDPLRRLRLDAGPKEPEAIEEAPTVRSSLPRRAATSEAKVTAALRDVERELADPLPEPWRDAVRGAVQSRRGVLPDALDSALVATDLGASRAPLWWGLVRVLQWLLIAAVLVGIGWLTLNAVLGYFGLPPFGTVPVGPADGPRIPLPTLLALGGVVAGLLASGASRLALGVASRRAGRRAARALAASVAAVADELVVAPAQAESARHARTRELLDRLAR